MNCIELYFISMILEKKLNADIGFHWWKKYIAFWCNISTPINLSITVITALTTGQATTQNLLPQNVLVSISIIALVLTTINTFFRPHTQMMNTLKFLQEWTEFGNRFESIYYKHNPDEKQSKYQELYDVIQQYKINESPDNQNFCTDFLHIIARCTCIKQREKWLDLDIEMQVEQQPHVEIEIH